MKKKKLKKLVKYYLGFIELQEKHIKILRNHNTQDSEYIEKLENVIDKIKKK